MSAAMSSVVLRAAPTRSCSASKPLTSLEVRAFAAPARPVAHTTHNERSVQKQSRSLKVNSLPFTQNRFTSKNSRSSFFLF